MSVPDGPAKRITFDGSPLTIEDILDLSRRSAAICLGGDAFRTRIEASAGLLEESWKADRSVYGVTTGVGDSVVRPIPAELVEEFPLHLLRFHGCGLGDALDPQSTRAVLAVRLASLCQGASGVRWELLELVRNLSNHDALPRIPEEGSVGASGDLTPLSYLAAVLVGEREVFFEGRMQPASEVLERLGLKPLRLLPKEALAIMNGTAVMTALACLAWVRARDLSRLAARVTSLCVLSLEGNRAHFHPRIFALKPHPGQTRAAESIARDIGWTPEYRTAPGQRLQDTYTLRCAPHVIGVLEDTLDWTRRWIETEINSANDNPLVDPEFGILHGGNFYGGHIAQAMDSLKTAVASVSDLLDRQVALLVNERSNRGLPPNLAGSVQHRLPVNHAFKAIHIATSAWTAEALKNTMPASSFSRSTESHNQDKVSMGTIAARDCLRVLELSEQTAVAAALAAVQALDLRERINEVPGADPRVAEFRAAVRGISAFVEEDRALEPDLRLFLEKLRSGALEGVLP
jgi:histidine ammonia-lyase